MPLWLVEGVPIKVRYLYRFLGAETGDNWSNTQHYNLQHRSNLIALLALLKKTYGLFGRLKRIAIATVGATNGQTILLKFIWI